MHRLGLRPEPEAVALRKQRPAQQAAVLGSNELILKERLVKTGCCEPTENTQRLSLISTHCGLGGGTQHILRGSEESRRKWGSWAGVEPEAGRDPFTHLLPHEGPLAASSAGWKLNRPWPGARARTHLGGTSAKLFRANAEAAIAMIINSYRFPQYPGHRVCGVTSPFTGCRGDPALGPSSGAGGGGYLRVCMCACGHAYVSQESGYLHNISLQIPGKQEVSEPMPFPFTVNQQPLFLT